MVRGGVVTFAEDVRCKNAHAGRPAIDGCVLAIVAPLDLCAHSCEAARTGTNSIRHNSPTQSGAAFVTT